MFETILWGALLVINLGAFCICGWDKFCAKMAWWRVPEHTLMSFAACLGSFGMLAGMMLFHHKTSKPKFLYGVPLMAAFQVMLIASVIRAMVYGG